VVRKEEGVSAEVDEVGKGVYRIAYYGAERRISFNQFLIDDERPTLVHTGHYDRFEEVRAGIAQVLDPKRLEYIVVTHFESDECGSMDLFAEELGATLVCSEVGSLVNLGTWNYRGLLKGMREGDRLELGERTLSFLETPHVHHWDSMMVYDELTRGLFASDLFLQPGEQPAVLADDLADEMCSWYRSAGIFAAESPVRSLLDRLQQLDIARAYPGHGGTLAADALPTYVSALRSQPFAFEGRLLGRSVSAQEMKNP
jgi:flavorubredoxin